MKQFRLINIELNNLNGFKIEICSIDMPSIEMDAFAIKIDRKEIKITIFLFDFSINLQPC